MAINEHLTEFAGYPVANWDAAKGIADPLGTIYRVGLFFDEQDEGEANWIERFHQFLDDPNSEQVSGLVIGDWGLLYSTQDSTAAVEAIIAAQPRLPNLKALFLGDVTYEECEISWLEHGDISGIFRAYPNLEQFCVRGANKLSFGQLQHQQLKSLSVQSGGLSVNIINEIFAAQLPNLEHLELWLGTKYYDGDATVNDLQSLLSGNLFPKLTYLGLRDSEIADDIAKAIANAPILNRITTLDLSMGTLGDEGAEALLASPLIPNLKKLDIHHHYCSEEVVDRLKQLRVNLDASNPRKADTYNNETSRYVAVSE